MELNKKAKKILVGSIAGLGVLTGVVGVAAASQKGGDPGAPAEATYKSSVTTPEAATEVDDAAEQAALAKLAKISEDDAKAAATAAVPGEVVEVDLEEEDGNVIYEVDVKGSDGRVTEVIVDAGNGKVLHQEAEDDDECDGAEANGRETADDHEQKEDGATKGNAPADQEQKSDPAVNNGATGN